MVRGGFRFRCAYAGDVFFHEVAGRAEVWFTDAADGDQRERTDVAAMNQVHGSAVAWAAAGVRPDADALLTSTPGQPVLVRVADCVPIVLVGDQTVGVVHAGRRGLMDGVIPAALAHFSGPVEAWIGPHICGRCYELPEQLADDVEAAVPGTRSTTTWGTPSSDLGAGARIHLAAAGVAVHDISACTVENERFFSHRRTGTPQRQAGIVVLYEA